MVPIPLERVGGNRHTGAYITAQLWEDIKDIITKIFLTVESQVNTSSPTPRPFSLCSCPE